MKRVLRKMQPVVGISSFLLLFSFGFMLTTTAQVDVTASAGTTSGSYTTLKGAFDAINAGTHQGAISIAISGNTTETASAVLSASGTGASAYTGITISPSGGAASTITGSIAGPLVDLDGADNVTIDGLNTGGNALTFSNTNTGNTAGTSTFRFINDATSNTLTNLSVLGASTGAASQNAGSGSALTATILFGNSTGTTGNDDNTISNSTIADAGALPTVAIGSAGQSATITNDNISITGNNIANFYGNSGANGVDVASNSTAWTITGNHFYQTASRSGLASSSYLENIYVNSPGGGFTISNNVIGYASPASSGMLTASGGRFLGIDIASVAAIPASSVQGNTINGIAWTTASGASGAGASPLGGIVVKAGAVTISGNTIGSATGTGTSGSNIFVTSTASGSAGTSISGIYVTSSSGALIQNNTIGAIGTGGAAGVGYTFFGITAAGSGNHTINSNMIGGSTSGSIALGVLGTTTAYSNFYGINITGSGTLVVGSSGAGNTVSNLVFNSTGSSSVYGIYLNSSSSASLTVSYNTFVNIEHAAATSSATTGLIYCNNASSTGVLEVSNNTFSSTAFNFSGATGGTASSYCIYNNSTWATTNFNSNIFDNISIKSSGSFYFCSNNTSTPNTNYNLNSIATGFAKTVSGGTVYLYYNFGSPSSGTATINGNNFSNIALAGSTTFDGIEQRTGTGQAEVITSNIISNVTGGTGTTYGIYHGYGNTGSLISNNQLSGITGGGTIYGIYIGSSAPISLNASGNSISSITGSGSSTVYGIYVNAGTLVNVSANKIYSLSTTNAGGAVYGIAIPASGTVNTYNNLVSGLTAATASGTDVIRGISIGASSGNFLVAYNTVYLNASSSGTDFGTSGIYHAGSTTASTAVLDLRNNIIINESAPSGAGLTVAFRRGTAAATDLASTSDHNLLYAGTPSATNVIYTDGTAQQTLADYLMNVLPVGHDINSFTGESFTYGTPGSFFTSLTGSSTDFLRPVAGITTQVESGAINIASPAITTDYTGAIRAGNAGYAGTDNNPDLGAYEFSGTTPAPVITLNSVTPGTTPQCTAAARVVSTTITTVSGTITGATIGYTVNGVPQANIPMTNTSGDTWEATIPVPSPSNATITWGVAAQSSTGLTATYTGTSYSDEPLTGTTASVTASNSTVCAGSPTTLTAAVVKNNYNATIGTGTSVTGNTEELTAFCNRRASYKMQILYTAAELSAAGLGAGDISSMAYTITSIGSNASNSAFTVKIGTTSLTALTDYVASTGFTTVFPSAAYTHAVGVNTINFSTPFNWDGTSNIVVEVSHTGTDQTYNAQTVYTTTTANTVAYGYNGASTGTLSTSRFNTTFTGIGAFPIGSVSWSDGTTTIGTTNPLTINPTATNTYTATITSAGCTVTPSPTATVTVNPVPTAPTATNSAQCGTQVPSASVASTSGLPSPIFNWYTVSTGGTPAQSSGSTTYGSLVAATTIFYVSEINSVTLCEGPRTPVTVNVSSADPVTLTAVPTSLCIGQSMTLTAENTNPAPLQNYTYSTVSTAGSGLESPAAGSSLTVTPTLAGTYTYTLTAVDGGCAGSATATVTVNPLAEVAATPVPADGATDICYSGSGAAVTAVSWDAAANATSYDVYFGAGSLPGSVSANVTATTYPTGTLLANTTYHWKVVAKNGCGDAVGSSEWTFTTSSAPCYCMPAGDVSSYWITNFTTANAVTNISNATAGSTDGYGDYTGQSASQYPGQPLDLNISVNASTHYFYVWIDYNDDGDFDDTDETPVATTSYTTALATTYTVPAGAPVGSHRMRIADSWSGAITSCGTAANGGEYEDYTFTVLPLCATTVTATTPATICGAGTAVLSATGSAGTVSYNWYSAAMGGTPIETVTTSDWTTPSISATTTFYVTAFDGTCETSVRVPVVATVNPVPASFAVTPATATICEGTVQNLASQGVVSGDAILGTGTTAPGTTSFPNPLSAYYGGTKHQMVYTASELTAQGMAAGSSITSVSFDLNTFAAHACNNFTIRMGNTALNTLTGFVSGTSTVYGPTTFTPSATGIVTFTLTTPYTWDGTSNIVVETVHNAGNSGNGSGTTTNTTTTATNTVYYGASDNVSGGIAGFDALSGYGTSGASMSRPNVHFAYTMTVTPSWTPAATLFTDAAATTAYTAGANAGSVYAKPIATTTYTATYSNSFGCTATSTAVVTVNPLPTVDAGTDQTVCEGTPITLNGSGATSYTWDNGVTDGVAFNATTTTTYTVTGTDANGCSNTDQVVLTVNPIPDVDAGADQVVCTGTSVTLTAAGTAASYTWDNSVTDGSAFVPASTATYTLTGTGANGCTNTDQVVVVVGVPSSSTLTETACSSYTLNSTTYNSSGTYTQVIPNTTACDSTITLNLTITQPSTSALTATACSSYTLNGTTYNSSGTYVQVVPNTAGCDSTITLSLTINQPTSSAVSATACSSYTWTETGMTYTASGAYTHTVMNAAGCDSVITLNLTINAAPVATAALNNYVLTASSGTSYQWIDCTTGAAVAGETSQTYSPAANGVFAVIVSNASGCSDTSACVNVTGLGVKELAADAINIYPNPTHNAVTIEMTVANATVEIHDAAGKLLRVVNVVSGDKIDLSEYERGIYMLNVRTEGGSSLTRVVKD